MNLQGLPSGYDRPVILHRAILGSVERMAGVLCEGLERDARGYQNSIQTYKVGLKTYTVYCVYLEFPELIVS